MRRLLSLFAGTLLLGGLTWAVPQVTPKQASLRCTLTNKTIEKCCCEKRGEKQYCTLAKKTVDKCCCVPVETPKEKKG